MGGLWLGISAHKQHETRPAHWYKMDHCIDCISNSMKIMQWFWTSKLLLVQTPALQERDATDTSPLGVSTLDRTRSSLNLCFNFQHTEMTTILHTWPNPFLLGGQCNLHSTVGNAAVLLQMMHHCWEIGANNEKRQWLCCGAQLMLVQERWYRNRNTPMGIDHGRFRNYFWVSERRGGGEYITRGGSW